MMSLLRGLKGKNFFTHKIKCVMNAYSLILFIVTNLALFITWSLMLEKNNEKSSFYIAITYNVIGYWLFFLMRDLDTIVLRGLWNTLVTDVYRDIHIILTINAIILSLIIWKNKGYLQLLILPSLSNFVLSLFFFKVYNFGIINFVWISIFSIFFTVYIYSILTFIDLNKIFKTKKLIAIKFTKEEATRNFRLGIQGLLALAASTGVSMSIIFKDGETSWHDDAILFDAMGIATGLVLMCIGVCIFLFLPYYILRKGIFSYYLEECPESE